ncbi:hypothetical protein WOLCODRAFT_152126 [Wolfiporia cocos MD-104 SS10]|uniref:Uncharacterized protein n=1 Tax=Wolfiporia cocos (strain MD-104) TaxID=742152 RepID=A0A2H3K0Y8_WOLCO|nr:hypothetical protein WOLCODRAFT_152126 [Wolfiporia cocos MD-104 SS10]
MLRRGWGRCEGSWGDEGLEDSPQGERGCGGEATGSTGARRGRTPPAAPTHADPVQRCAHNWTDLGQTHPPCRVADDKCGVIAGQETARSLGNTRQCASDGCGVASSHPPSRAATLEPCLAVAARAASGDAATQQRTAHRRRTGVRGGAVAAAGVIGFVVRVKT